MSKTDTTSSTEQLWQAINAMSHADRERFFEQSRTQGFASQIELAWRQRYAKVY